MVRDVTAAVDERCGGLLAGVLAPQSGLHSFNLLANSVVAEVDDALARSRPGADPDPDSFHGPSARLQICPPSAGSLDIEQLQR